MRFEKRVFEQFQVLMFKTEITLEGDSKAS